MAVWALPGQLLCVQSLLRWSPLHFQEPAGPLCVLWLALKWSPLQVLPWLLRVLVLRALVEHLLLHVLVMRALLTQRALSAGSWLRCGGDHNCCATHQAQPVTRGGLHQGGASLPDTSACGAPAAAASGLVLI